ncbi:MAG: hypothetical protein AAGD35_17670 [Actinomycetota bacterium]
MPLAFPQTFDEWRRCITVDCGIDLTPAFITMRLTALQDRSDAHTAQFAETYGDDYLQQVIEWFELARSGVESGQG